MQKTLFFIRTGLVVWLLVATLSPLQAGTKSEIRSLAHTPAVKVVVEDLSRSAEQAGLQKERLYAVAVQYLQQAGMTVLDPKARYRVPLVYVRLSAVSGGERNADLAHLLSFYMTLHVKQFARLADGQPVTGHATAENPEPNDSPLLVTTWENGTIVMLDRSELHFYTQQILTNLLAELTSDWRAAKTEPGA